MNKDRKVFVGWGFLFLLLMFLIFNLTPQRLFCTRSFAGSIFISTELQQMEQVPEKLLPGPGFLEKAANFLYIIYDYIRRAIIFLLQKTLFKENPKLASFYGDVASFLASLTAVYLLLLLISSAKKIIGVILLLGWALFVVAILVRS